MFLTPAIYIRTSNLTSTTLTIDISETSYYIKNVQSPIAKEPEIIFRTLLFSIMCLEISALIFLIFKLLLIPLYKKIVRLVYRNSSNEVAPMENEHHH